MTECVHRWQLTENLTRDVPGRCSLCGEERVFAGGVPYTIDRPFSTRGRQFSPGNDMQSRRRGASNGGKATAKKVREARNAA